MGNYDDLKSALSTANAEADALNNDLAASQDQVQELQNQVADLQRQLDECQDGGNPPDPTPATTIFGSSDNANVPGYDKVGSARKYYGGQIETSISNSVKAMIDHATHVLWVSFKALPGTGTNTPLDQFLKACKNLDLKGIKIGNKTVKVMVTVFHEPENDNNNQGHNLTEYENAYSQARVIVDRYDYAALGPIRMNSKDATANNKYWPKNSVMDFDGWDCYYQGIQCPKNYDQTGAAVYSKILGSKDGKGGLVATGKPLAIGETGIGRIGSGSATDPKRIQRATEMHDALANSDHTVLASWWNAKNDESSKCSNPTGCQFVDKKVADAWL